MLINYILNRHHKQAKVFEITLDKYVECIKNGIHPNPVKDVDILKDLKSYKKENLPYASIPITYVDYRGGEIKNYNPIFIIDIDFIDGATKDFYLDNKNKKTKKWQAYNTIIDNVYSELERYKQYTIMKRSYNNGVHMMVRYDYNKLTELDIENKLIYHRKLVKTFTDFATDIVLKECNSLGYDPILAVDNVSYKPSQLNVINYDKNIYYQPDYVFEYDDDLVNAIINEKDIFTFNTENRKDYTNDEITKLNDVFIEKLIELNKIYGKIPLFHKKLMEIFERLKNYDAPTYISLKYSSDKTIKLFYQFLKKMYKGTSMKNNLKDINTFYKWIKNQSSPQFILPLNKIYNLTKLLYEFEDVMQNKYDDVIDVRDKTYLENTPELDDLLKKKDKLIIKGQPGIGKTTYFMKYLIEQTKLGKKVAYVSPKILILNQIEHDYKNIDFEKYYGGNDIIESNFILATYQQLHKIIDKDIDIIIYDEIQNFIEYITFDMKINNISNVFDYDRKHIFISGTPELFKMIYDYTYVNILSAKSTKINIIPHFRKKLDYIISILGEKDKDEIIYIYKNNKNEIKKIIDEINKHFPHMKVGQVHNGEESSKDDENEILKNYITEKNHIPSGYDVIITTDKLNEGVNINNTNICRVIIDYSNDTNIFKVQQVRNRFRKIQDKNIYDVFVYNYSKNDDDLMIYDMVDIFRGDVYDNIDMIKSDCIRYNENEKTKKLRMKTGITDDFYYCSKTKNIHPNIKYIIRKLYGDFEDKLKSKGKIIDYIENTFKVDWLLLKSDDDETGRKKSPIKEFRKTLSECFKPKDKVYSILYDNILDCIVDLFNDDKYDEKINTIKDVFNLPDGFLFNNKSELYKISERWVKMKNYNAHLDMSDDEIIKIATYREKTFNDKLKIMELKYIDNLDVDIQKADENEMYLDHSLLKSIINSCNVYEAKRNKRKYVLLDDVFNSIRLKENDFLNRYKNILNINNDKKLKSALKELGYKIGFLNKKEKDGKQKRSTCIFL